MKHTQEETGVILALLKRLVEQRLPRLQEMKVRVDRGELLDDSDIDFLEGALHDANQNRKHVVQFPEYAGVIGQLTQLYAQITAKALENQQSAKR